MARKKEIDPVFMLDFINSIEDPRIDRTKKHSLETIIIIAICAVICGAKSWNEIEVYGTLKFDFLNKFLNLENGVPSHDTFRRFVSVDTLNCQKEIAEKIISKGGDYLFCVKNNQENLRGRIEEKFKEYENGGRRKNEFERFEKKEKVKHGRLEKRSIKIIKEKDDSSLGVNPLLQWKDLKTIIEISAERVDQKTGEIQNSKRYYISSRNESAEYFF